MSLNPEDLKKILDEVKASRASRQRAWQNLQEIRYVLSDTAQVELPPPARKTIDLEGRIVKDGVRKALKDRQTPAAGRDDPFDVTGRRIRPRRSGTEQGD
jgi:hypothetical protein